MGAARYITILWPGLPWLWLRGSFAGLVVALAFALTLDLAILSSWVWSDLFGPWFTVAVWGATVLIWVMATGSAFAAFPPAIPRADGARIGPLFVAARNAYLGRDWPRAEARIRELLAIAPTDGEAQLLHATLLRRLDRVDEARAALGTLAASDAGIPWRVEIAAELSRIEEALAVHRSDSRHAGVAAEPRRRAA